MYNGTNIAISNRERVKRIGGRRNLEREKERKREKEREREKVLEKMK